MKIFAGWLIDGTGGPVLKNVLLHIENGYIRDITQVSCWNMKQDALDLSECTVIPGLIDCHVHLSISGTNNMSIRERQLKAPFEDIRDLISYHIQELLKFGVVAVRDGGDHNAHVFRYVSESAISENYPIILKISGKAWHKPGRYGSLIGRPPGNRQSLASAILQEAAGTDQVKIVQSGLNSLKYFGKQTPPQFLLEELKPAVKAAKSLGLSVMVHSNGDIPTRIAIESGCDSIEHGFFMGDDNLKRMADNGIIWIPTACTMKGYAKQLPQDSLEAGIALRNLEHQLEQIAKAKAFGVSIATGTDSGCMGVFHGAAMIEELRLLMNAGFSVSEAIQCATLNGAKLLKLTDMGALIPGMKADFIAVSRSPARFPDSLHLGKLYRSAELY